MEQSSNGYNVEYIPPNFKEGVSVFGFMIKIGNVLQAVPFIALIVLLVFTAGANLSTLVKLIILIVTVLPVAFLGAVGINGDSLFAFLRNVIKTARVKRMYLYNPRVKAELKASNEETSAANMLPREKIQMFMDEKRTKKEQIHDYKKFDFDGVFFEDDEGFAEKPYETLNGREKKAVKKARKL